MSKQKLESILLFKGQPVSYIELAKLLETDEKAVKNLITELEVEYKEKGMRIVYSLDECELVTSPETYELILKLQKHEKETDLSPATLETLSIILYMGPIARNMIDFIRGVNSQFTLRTLLVRGLVEKDPREKSTKYIVTLDTIKFLGLNKLDELPNYLEVKHSITQFIKENSNDSVQ